jgi:GntR family transcriptional regulator, transcriptional repressor for pyruvate dehydrogenase complex
MCGDQASFSLTQPSPQPERGRHVEVVSGKAFRVVHKTRVSEEIVGQVRDLITSGRLKVGDRLPAERELAKTLQVGRSTVREAIRVMESLGFLQARPGEGTFLVSHPAEPRPDPVTAGAFKSWDNQRKLFEVRMVIEPDLAALAARRATFDQIVKMREILLQQEGIVKQGATGIEADSTFHFLLAEAAGNDILLRIMDSLMDLLRETREASLQTGGRPARSLKQHRAILRAIEGRDPRTAEQKMREHISEMEQLVFTTQEWPAGSVPASATASLSTRE